MTVIYYNIDDIQCSKPISVTQALDIDGAVLDLSMAFLLFYHRLRHLPVFGINALMAKIESNT